MAKKTATKKRATKKKATRKKRAARKVAKKQTTRKRVAKKSGRRGRRSKLANVPLAQLQAEVERRQSVLIDRRQQLQQELDAIDQELAGFDGSPRPRRGRPPGRPARKARGGRVSLVDALQATLSGKTMGVAEAADAVQKAGYTTTSSNFRTIVNQALLNNPKKFRKVARGKYTAR